EGEAEDDDGEGEGEIEGQEEVEVESEAEAYNVDLEQGESEGERAQSSPEREVSDQKMESEPKDAESEEEGYGQRVVATRRREVVASESDESEGDHEDEEMNSDQHRQPRLMSEQKDHEVVRDVFGDSDEDEPAEYGDESGAKKRIRLEDNIVRWRRVKNRDGTVSMKFMPSSLSSKSHRLLTALVDSRHKKVYKVKNCITEIDPEKEKEEKERLGPAKRSRSGRCVPNLAPPMAKLALGVWKLKAKVLSKLEDFESSEPLLPGGYGGGIYTCKSMGGCTETINVVDALKRLGGTVPR
ncbi:hypothetical protein BHM03_00018018, partial [Ensete ventricosum]